MGKNGKEKKSVEEWRKSQMSNIQWEKKEEEEEEDR